MRYFNGMCLAVLAVLPGCGGSGGSGGGAVAVVTPAPSSAPSATPAAVASPFDLSHALLFQPFSAELRIVSRYAADAPRFYRFESGMAALGDELSGTVLSWDPQAGDYGVRRGTEFIRYGRADRSPDVPANGTQYLNYARALPARAGLSDYTGTGTASLNGTTTSYVVTGRETERSSYFEATGAKISLEVERDFVTGLATPTTSIPVVGSARWQGRISVSLVVDTLLSALGGTGTIDVDYTGRTVRGTIVAEQTAFPTNAQPLVVTLSIDATIDPATGRVAGSVRSTDGRFDGRVLGRLFGPQATELGLVLTMTWQNGIQPASGRILAAR